MRNDQPHGAPPHLPQIKAELARRGATQAQLAAALGITQSGISRRLTGIQPFRTDELEAVADFLGVQITINLESVA